MLSRSRCLLFVTMVSGCRLTTDPIPDLVGVHRGSTVRHPEDLEYEVVNRFRTTLPGLGRVSAERQAR